MQKKNGDFGSSWFPLRHTAFERENCLKNLNDAFSVSLTHSEANHRPCRSAGPWGWGKTGAQELRSRQPARDLRSWVEEQHLGLNILLTKFVRTSGSTSFFRSIFLFEGVCNGLAVNTGVWASTITVGRVMLLLDQFRFSPFWLLGDVQGVFSCYFSPVFSWCFRGLFVVFSLLFLSYFSWCFGGVFSLFSRCFRVFSWSRTPVGQDIGSRSLA